MSSLNELERLLNRRRPSGSAAPGVSVPRVAASAQLVKAANVQQTTPGGRVTLPVIPTKYKPRRPAAQSGSTGSSIAKTLLGAFTLAPVISGLFSLFGGGKKEPPPLVRYRLPARENFDFGLNGQGLSNVRYQAGGVPQALQAGASTGFEQVTAAVNTETLDRQWFLDRSDMVASAVRKALLDSHPLADVLGEV